MSAKTKQKAQKHKVEEAPPTQKFPKPSSLSAVEKCRAVLSIWTERRKVSEVSKEMNIQWAILNHWQNRALEGMMQALEPRIPLEKGPALSQRLQKMLDKRNGKKCPEVASTRLEERLNRLQETKEDRKQQKTKA